MPKSHAVGIDLGTTYSVVARLDENGKTQIVRNPHGDILTPSVVLFDDKETIVGKEAKKFAAVDSDRVAECAKRDMGNEFYSKRVRGERLPPEVIQACILRALGADARRVCGTDIKVVITVPAYFDEPRRKATSDAGEMAGLNVLDIVNEPTAAALSFGEHLGYLDPKGSPKEAITVLVYDLGGGTFDVTVIELSPGNLRTLATDGDVRLGGQDWDERLANHIAEQFQAKHGKDPRQEPASMTRLMRAVEEAKQTLTARTVANVHLECGGKSVDLSIARETFEQLTEDLLERTAFTTRHVLQAAGTSWQYISHVLLVGGSTRMPMVGQMLEKVSGGMKPEHIVNPDEAVARGAAIYAGYLMASRGKADETIPSSEFEAVESTTQTAGPQFAVTNVNAHSLGIEGINQETLRKENIILIPRNTPLPRKVQERFVTQNVGQQSVVVQVLEGESSSPSQCTRVARAVLRHLPSGLPQGYPIEVIYEYGTNSRLSVRAKLEAASQELHLELERENSLNNARLARWKVVLAEEEGFDAFAAALDEALQMESPDGGPARPSTPRPASTKLQSGPQQQVVGKPQLQPQQQIVAQPQLQPQQKTLVQPKTPFPEDELPTGKPSAPSTQFEIPAAVPYVSGQSSRKLGITVAGHILASLIGLSVGYYLLCWLQPTANFLNLRLPGLPATAEQPIESPPADTDL